jgi:hypothetical protein
MLQELGVLPVRQLDKEVALEALFSRCDPETARVLRRYCEQLAKTRYATRGRYGAVRMVFEFQLWLTKHELELGLFTVSEKNVLRYLHALNDRDRSGIRRQVLSRFYRWAQVEKLTLMNPVQGVPVPKMAKILEVCSDHQIRKIELYVKNPASDPEYALILALVLYWGITTLELALSSVDFRDSQIWIILYRRELSRGRKTHYRDQVLKLPLDPLWLASLQKRYTQLWRERLTQAKKNFPNQPLILRRSARDRSTRPLAVGRVIDLFCDATIAATGQRIPPNVVRRTSGHIHVDRGDASRLTKLGWSKTYSHAFSYRPRTYFTSSGRP